MMMQTLAMLRDAYHELNHKRLFWFVLILSALIVGAFAALSINDRGFVIFIWQIDSIFNSSWIPRNIFYKMLFVNLGIKWWLAWIAGILALVSTAGLMPDFIASGSIDLTLSRPISRLRLFFLKYLSGLLFVTLQVLIFSLGSFLVIGLRAKVWEPSLLLAVPITVAIFSFLHCISTLLGLLTRSTIASLLLTLLFWFAIFGIHTSEQMLFLFKERALTQQDHIKLNIQQINDRAAKRLSNPDKLPKDVDRTTGLTAWETQKLESKTRRLPDVTASARKLSSVHFVLYAFKTILPKTSETTELLDRALISSEEMDRLHALAPDRDNGMEAFAGEDDEPIDMNRLNQDVEKKVRARSIWWILGTSFLFEFVILAIAARIFCRRDF